MFKKLPHLIIILTCVLFATMAAATNHSIHIEWGYTPPSNPPLSGFNLYQEGTLACTTNNPEVTAMDCDVSLEKDTTNFTLTAIFNDGSESPHSAPFPFSTLNDHIAESPSSDTGSHRFTFTWESTSSAKSYRVYLNNKRLCETEDPNASSITCNTDFIDGLMTFSMTEVSSLGIESSPSNLLLFDPTAYPNLFNPKQVQLTWEYPTEKGLAGFRVYQNNTLLCETDNPATRQLTCMANLTSPVVEFNIAAVDSNNNETALSNTLTYTRESLSTNTVTSTLPNDSLLLANTSSEPNDTTSVAVVNDPTQTTIQIQPIVYTTSLFTDQSESIVLSQMADTYDTLPEPTNQTSAAPSGENLPSFNLEVGELSINAQWKSVVLATPFQHPIAIAKLPVTNNLTAGSVHLRNITSTGFEIAYTGQNDPNLENITVHYMVMEQGRFLLNQTTLVEAGSFSGSNRVENIYFAESFVKTPVVLTTLATSNQPEILISQLIDINTDNFGHSILTQETNNTVINETVHYIAWEQGSGTLDTIAYDASISSDPLTDVTKDLSQQTPFPEPIFLFPCELTGNDQETDTLQSTTETVSTTQLLPGTTISVGYLAIAPSQNEVSQ